MRVVEVGQYFVTREQIQTVACREYTLPRDDQASQPKGWIQGNMRIGPVLEVTTSFQHFKYGIEIRIKSVNQDDSHSWVRISYGTVKYVNDSIEDNTQNPVDSQEEESVQTSSSVVAARSKAKAKPQPRESTGTTTIPLRERKWIDIEPSKQVLESHNLSKKVINLLRHNQKLHREEDGAIQFYRIKFHLRDHHSQIQNWSDERWKSCLSAGGGSKRKYQYCSDNLGSIIYLRALQGHSGSNLIDPALQDNVLIGPGIFPYIYHVGSNFNLHSMIRNGLVPGGQNLSRRQTVFFLPIHPRNEDHKDPEFFDFSAPRLARYMHRAWKRHQDAVFWVDIDLGTGKPVEEMIAEEWESSSAQIRTMLNEQRKTIVAEYCEKVSHHELLAAQAEHERRILQEELLRQQQDFHEVHQQDLIKMKEVQKFQNSTFDEFTRQKFIEDQKTIMELSGRLQELQNEVNCMNDSRDFRDAESICSGNSHVTSPPGLFPRHPPFEGLLKPALISQRQTEEPPNIRDTSGTSGNVFAHPQTSSSAPYPQELNSTWRKTIEEPIHMSTAEKSGRPERDSDLRCQFGPSAKDSVIFNGGDSSKNYGADQQRLQISDLHFDTFPAPATFACWKIRFKTEVCTCSKFPTEAMQWIKEVELVDSVDELRSSSSTRGISMPNFEVLDARIASALNKIIHQSHFKRKISLEEQKAQKEDRFLRGRQIAYLIYEQFRVTGTDDSVENYTDLFTIVFEMTIFRNSILSGTEYHCL